MEIKTPLAQSFYVSSEAGIFATSIDLYFYAKDPTQSITIQLRPLEMGVPSTTVYPDSEVTLYPNQVKISETSTVPTTFTFPSPVYLTGKTYHSIVLICNSAEYKVWISRVGEFDAQNYSSTNSRQVLSSTQPDYGSLFLSQSGSTWTASQYDDLKYTLYKANFNTSEEGTINFYNSDLDGISNTIKLLKDPLEFNSRQIRVGLSKTVTDSNLKFGNTIVQSITNATGDFIGYGGSAFGNLKVIDDGESYENGSYSNIPLISLTGSGKNATVNLTIANGVVVSSGATISDGGVGYKVGDLLTINPPGTNKLGRNIKLSVSNIAGYNELILSQVQGNFETGVGKTIRYINNSGITTDLNGVGSNVLLLSSPVEIYDGRHVKVNHFNHGMHSTNDLVKISNAFSDVAPTTLLSNKYEPNSSSDILLEDTSNFTTFEGLSVSSDNLGYILIGEEIISYNQVSGNSLRGITRGVDSTKKGNYELGVSVYKYELNNISLRRINTTHELSNSTINDPIGLDYYNIKLLMSSNGKDRTSTSPLYIKETKSAGGNNVSSTRNIQYSIIIPNVQTFSPPTTNINSFIRTVSGKSVDGTETPYVDQGFEGVSLKSTNYLNSNRAIYSTVNEKAKLPDLPGNKSFNLNLSLSSANPDLSPMISALDRTSVVLTSNRIDNKIQNYATDDRVSSLIQDPSSFVYATKPITLENPAQSIKVILSAYINIYNDVRILYSVSNDTNLNLNYFPFPGYLNLNNDIIIDSAKSDGTADVKYTKTDVLISRSSSETPFVDYEFTAESIGPFRTFSIKIVGSSTNQTYPPRIKDLRIIALS